MTDVLIVDDNAEIARMLRIVLELEGFSVQWARHGQEALDWLGQAMRPPRAMLIDLSMPEMDGPTFIRHVMRWPTLSAVPLIVMSAEAHPETRVRGLPVTAVLTKPFGMEALLRHIGDALAHPVAA